VISQIRSERLEPGLYEECWSLTYCMRFEASGSEVGLCHQEQNCEGDKAQSWQYIAGWAGLLHLVSEPRTTHLKVGGLWYPTSEATVQSQGFMSNAGRWPVVRVLGRQAQKWARVTRNKTVRAVRPKTDNIWQVEPGYYKNPLSSCSRTII